MLLQNSISNTFLTKSKNTPVRDKITVQIILLKRLVCAVMIAHEDGHNLAFAEFSLVVSAAFSATVLRWQTEVILQFFVQIFVKLVDNTENFCNFVLGNHRFFVL